MNRRFRDVNNFMKCVNIKWCNPVIFSYLGSNSFRFRVFQSSGTEICDDGHKYPNLCENATVSDESLSKDELVLNDRQIMIKSNMELALFRINAHGYPLDPIRLQIVPEHVNGVGDYVVSSTPL